MTAGGLRSVPGQFRAFRLSNRQSAIGDRQFRRAPRAAFTLIEILTVIAIIGILATIAITAGRGIQERSKIAKAKADMAVLAAALEQYKQHYGDYPWTPGGLDGGAVMFNALCGNLGPKATSLPSRGRTFVELSKFTLANGNVPDPNTTTTVPIVNWFNDPWSKPDNSNWYYYQYRRDAPGTPIGDQWKSPGYLLYSHGPDGACNIGIPTVVGQPANTGYLENFPSGFEAVNADNIYYGRD